MSSKYKPSTLLKKSLLLEHNNPCSFDTDKDFYCAYAGPSMHPTLKSGDLLKIVEYENNTPRIGDVILFVAPELNNPVVHRIISNKNGMFKTRGDNCSHIDPWEIVQKVIIGKITGAVRGKININIKGGLSGRTNAFWCRTYNLLTPKLSIGINKTFKILHAHTLFPTINFPKKRLHTIRFVTNGTQSHRLMLDAKYIGHYDRDTSSWRIIFPYRFLLKKASLPKI